MCSSWGFEGVEALCWPVVSVCWTDSDYAGCSINDHILPFLCCFFAVPSLATTHRVVAAGWAHHELLGYDWLAHKYGVAHAQPIVLARKA